MGPPLPLHAPINSTVDFPVDLGDGARGGGGGKASRLQECCVGAKVAVECHLLSLADCALADHFPFTSPLRAAGVWPMNQLLRLQAAIVGKQGRELNAFAVDDWPRGWNWDKCERRRGRRQGCRCRGEGGNHNIRGGGP